MNGTPLSGMLPEMDEPTEAFEEAARIVEAYAEAEDDARVIELLADIARDIRARPVND